MQNVPRGLFFLFYAFQGLSRMHSRLKFLKTSFALCSTFCLRNGDQISVASEHIHPSNLLTWLGLKRPASLPRPGSSPWGEGLIQGASFPSRPSL